MLSELGYARTSLREIARNSECPDDVLHYYFTDKVDLIMHCVKQYTAECVRRYDEIVSTSLTPDDLKRGFAAGLATTICEDASMYPLWCDLRSQSLFDESFGADVGEIDQSLEWMIWSVVSRYAELADASPIVTSSVAYAMFDGMFQRVGEVHRRRRNRRPRVGFERRTRPRLSRLSQLLKPRSRNRPESQNITASATDRDSERSGNSGSRSRVARRCTGRRRGILCACCRLDAERFPGRTQLRAAVRPGSDDQLSVGFGELGHDGLEARLVEGHAAFCC